MTTVTLQRFTKGPMTEPITVNRSEIKAFQRYFDFTEVVLKSNNSIKTIIVNETYDKFKDAYHYDDYEIGHFEGSFNNEKNKLHGRSRY